MLNFKEYMGANHTINKWMVSMIFLAGVFTGACMTIIIMIGGLLG